MDRVVLVGGDMIDLLLEIVKPFLPILAGAGAVLLAWVAGRSKGRSTEKERQAQRDLTNYKANRERMDDETPHTDADDARDSLRDRQR